MEEKIDISKLIKAQKIFERFRIDMKTDRDKAGAIQAFEFCYELSWKMTKRILTSKGVTEMGFPKAVFRKAAIAGVIVDPEIWFEFQKKRNLVSHAYNQESMDEIIEVFDLFSIELATLITKLQEEV